VDSDAGPKCPGFATGVQREQFMECFATSHQRDARRLAFARRAKAWSMPDDLASRQAGAPRLETQASGTFGLIHALGFKTRWERGPSRPTKTLQQLPGLQPWGADNAAHHGSQMKRDTVSLHFLPISLKTNDRHTNKPGHFFCGTDTPVCAPAISARQKARPLAHETPTENLHF
jgi:hypothetical protein